MLDTMSRKIFVMHKHDRLMIIEEGHICYSYMMNRMIRSISHVLLYCIYNVRDFKCYDYFSDQNTSHINVTLTFTCICATMRVIETVTICICQGELYNV